MPDDNDHDDKFGLNLAPVSSGFLFSGRSLLY